MTEPSPYLTVGALRQLLDTWPDDRPVLVGTVAGTVSRVVYSCHESVVGTDTDGVFRTVARPPAEYMELDPPLPNPPGQIPALVLRGEVPRPSREWLREMIAESEQMFREENPAEEDQ